MDTRPRSFYVVHGCPQEAPLASHGRTGVGHMHEETEREVQAGEMLYAGVLQAYAWAPEYSAIWLACRALLPEVEARLEALGSPRPRRPEDLAGIRPRD